MQWYCTRLWITSKKCFKNCPLKAVMVIAQILHYINYAPTTLSKNYFFKCLKSDFFFFLSFVIRVFLRLGLLVSENTPPILFFPWKMPSAPSLQWSWKRLRVQWCSRDYMPSDTFRLTYFRTVGCATEPAVAQLLLQVPICLTWIVLHEL